MSGRRLRRGSGAPAWHLTAAQRREVVRRRARRQMVAFGVAVGVAVAGLVALTAWAATRGEDPPVEEVDCRFEDRPVPPCEPWDCETEGNRICGPIVEEVGA